MLRLTNKNKLIKQIFDNVPDRFEELVKDAIRFAQKYHEGEKRHSGEDFIIHSLNVAKNCGTLKLDTNSIICAILHQTISKRFKTEEQSKNILEEINREFGEDVYNLINGVDQINEATKLQHNTDISVLKKYLMSGVSDIRPTLIKICDVLDDVQSLDSIPKEKVLGFANKVFNVYSPLCEYLNLGEVKAFLEENAFKYSDDEQYKWISSKLIEKGIDDSLKEKYLEYLQTILDILGYKIEIKGRIKSPYSTFKKLSKYEKESKGTTLNSIKDLAAFSLLVQNEKDCYEVAHAIQHLTDNDPSGFDDYILFPKPNGYKAIHLCVRIPEISDIWIEVQILTHEMYHTNTYGPASHIAYKAALERFAKASNAFNWIEQIHNQLFDHINKREDQRSIPISGDIFKNQIFVQTPQGKIIELEVGSTALDMAYKIHTEIGNASVSAVVDGRPVSLSHVLKTGQTVEIVTRNGKKKPDIHWLEFAKLLSTKREIREALRKY